jgi:hypothetical protein
VSITFDPDYVSLRLTPNSYTFYSWRRKYGGMDVNEARRLKDLERENKKLKQLLAEQILDNQALKEMLKASKNL